jgi:hypothetical protein
VIVTHGNGYKHGYEIDAIEKRGGQKVIILKDKHELQISNNILIE